MSLGAALLLGAFLFQLQALVLAFSKFMDPLWAAVVLGLGVGLLGYSLVKSAAKKVAPHDSARNGRFDRLHKPCSNTIAR